MLHTRNSTVVAVSTLVDIIFDEKATAIELMKLVAALGVFWAIFFAFVSVLLRPLVYGFLKPILIAAGERDYERGGKELHADLGMPQTKEEFVETFLDLWPWNQAVIVQHFTGGLLCLPAVLGIGDETTAASLACLGILSEMGWELEDMLTWLHKRFFHLDGKKKVPVAILVVLGIHHSMTTILGLPMVLHFRNLRALHLLCFDLQAAAAVSLGVTEYTKLLDVSKPNQLRQFQVLTFVALAVMVWTRALHWVYLCFNLITVWYEEKAWVFLCVGSLLSIVFSLFNWVFCIKPFYRRFVKFMKMSAEYKSLPADADVGRRRSSAIELQAAAADILLHRQVQKDLSSLIVRRKVDRRGTVPPSLFSAENKKRTSMVLLRASAGDISHLLSQLDRSSFPALDSRS